MNDIRSIKPATDAAIPKLDSRIGRFIGYLIGVTICIAVVALIASLAIWGLVLIWRSITG